MITLRVTVILGILGLAGSVGRAAEIELRRECRPAGSLVTLGDVASVRAADPKEAQALAAAELFPSPPPGQQRFLRIGELQDLLLLRGVALAQHRMSGASQVAIYGNEGRVEGNLEPLSTTLVKKAERELSDTIVRYLQQTVGGSESWSVRVELDDTQARLVAKLIGNLTVRGGTPPWVGRQVFEVTAGRGDGAQRLTVQAFVSLPLSVVVSTHSLSRGAVIGPADVRLATGKPGESQGDSFRSIDEVLGCETTQAIADGAVVPKRAVRTPLLVRRSEIVTVYARAAGICVRTAARAREDGSLGDLVSVESLADRKAFVARVCGIRELEVFARAPQAEPAMALPMGASVGMR